MGQPSRGDRSDRPSPWRMATPIGLLLLATVAVIGWLPFALGDAVAKSPTKIPVAWDFTDSGLCGFPIESVGNGLISDRVGIPGPGGPLELQTGPLTVRNTDLLSGSASTFQVPSPTFFRYGAGTVTIGGQMWGIGAGFPYARFDGQMTIDLNTGQIMSDSGKFADYDLCHALSPGTGFFSPQTSAPPWGLPPTPLAGVYRDSLTPLIGGLAGHVHAHLDVYANGTPVTIPAGIGIVDPQAGGPESVYSAVGIYSPLHTHTSDGIIHIETSAPPYVLTLGEFFDVWQVRLANGCLGDSCTGLHAWVNGAPWPGDPRSIPLLAGDEIAVATGPNYPNPIPSSFSWSPDVPPVVIPPPN